MRLMKPGDMVVWDSDMQPRLFTRPSGPHPVDVIYTKGNDREWLVVAFLRHDLPNVPEGSMKEICVLTSHGRLGWIWPEMVRVVR